MDGTWDDRSTMKMKCYRCLTVLSFVLLPLVVEGLAGSSLPRLRREVTTVFLSRSIQESQREWSNVTSKSSKRVSVPSRGRRARTPTKSSTRVEQELALAMEALHAALATESTDAVHLLLFPTVRECNSALASFGDDREFLRALRLFGKMRKAAVLQDRLRERTEATLNWPVPAPTLVTYSTLMSRFVKADKPAVALRLWNLMQDHDFQIDVKAANILMNCYAKMADVETAQKLLIRMKEDPSRMPAPNIITYNTLLSACQKAGNLDAAVATMEDMRSRRVRPDTMTYTTLIASVARRASKAAGRYDPSLAFQFLSEMKQQNIRPNGMTYSALVDSCGRCQRVDLALQGLRMMLRQKAQEEEASEAAGKEYTLPNEVGAWTAAINACGRQGRIETALRLFYSMPNFGVQPNTVTCGALTDSLLRAGRTADTLKVLRYMKKARIPPSEYLYTSLMSRAESLVKMEHRIRSHREQQHRHIRGLLKSETEIQSADEDTKAIEVYTELIKSLVENSVHAASATRYSKRYEKKAQARPGSASLLLLKAFLVFQEMKTSRVEIDLPCYNTLLRVCAQAGDHCRARDVFTKMQNDNLVPNDKSWRMLIRSAINGGENAVDAVETVWKEGISYRPRQRIDDPAPKLWTPSLDSFLLLISFYMKEAGRLPLANELRFIYYRKIARLYEQILLCEEDEMGCDRIDLDRLLGSARVMIVILKAMVSLDADTALAEGERQELRSMAASISELACFLDLNTNDWVAGVRGSRAVEDTLRKARSWSV